MRGRLAILDEHKLTPRATSRQVIDAMDPLDGARRVPRLAQEPRAGRSSSPTRSTSSPPRSCASSTGRASSATGSRSTTAGASPATGCASPTASAARCESLRALNFRVVAAGDSYNDTTMLAAADARHPVPAAAERDRRVPAVPRDEDVRRTEGRLRRAQRRARSSVERNVRGAVGSSGASSWSRAPAPSDRWSAACSRPTATTVAAGRQRAAHGGDRARGPARDRAVRRPPQHAAHRDRLAGRATRRRTSSW